MVEKWVDVRAVLMVASLVESLDHEKAVRMVVILGYLKGYKLVLM